MMKAKATGRDAEMYTVENRSEDTHSRFKKSKEKTDNTANI